MLCQLVDVIFFSFLGSDVSLKWLLLVWFKNRSYELPLIWGKWVLFSDLFCSGEGVNLAPSPYPSTSHLKLNSIKLETWNLARKYTYICSFKKYTFKYTKTLLILWSQRGVFVKNQYFCQNSTFTQTNSMKAVSEIFQFCFQFL